jgi:hypothetical protein
MESAAADVNRAGDTRRIVQNDHRHRRAETQSFLISQTIGMTFDLGASGH